MRLDKLRLYGFKSFADKTEFHFEPGLTGFVGPNGCGKSNIVDAVRWALGEQRPKSLRGSEMADVIFKGNTEGRRSLGFAEATVTLSNEDRALAVEYDEVAITRRLYRSGESEYLLNNQACRLRDIRELLMDTGIGMDAYSVVEQGKIDVILQSNPKDRRAIFEEAAGISKYNAKRRAAMAKLERVEQNLLRLGDTIEEVKKRLRSIRRQASAARRYKEYAESLGRLRLSQTLHQYHQLVEERRRTRAAIAASEERQRALAATIERLEAERTALETESIDHDQRLARVGARHAEIRAQSEAVEENIRLNRERIRDAEAAEERTKEELRQLGERLENARRALDASEERSRQLGDELQEVEAKIEAARQALQGLGGQCAELTRGGEGLRTELLDGLRQRAACQNELVALQSECRALDAQRQRLGRRRAELARLAGELGREREQTEQRIEQLEKEIGVARAQFAARAEERGELRAQIESLSEQIAEASNTLSAKKSRRDLLEDLEARFEGVELGTQTLLERQADGQRLHGMVADLLQVEPQYALAIEAALGGAVQHLVADTLDSAAEAVSHLKTVKGGRTTLLPLDRLSGNGNGSEGLEHPGVIGRALDLVRYAQAGIQEVEARLEELQRQRDHFINESAVLDSELEEARQSLNHLNLDLATAREHLSRLGERAKALQEEDLVGQSEARELEVELEQRRARMAAAADGIQALERQEEELKGRLDALEQERHAAEEQRRSLERQCGDLAVARAHKTSEHEHLRATTDRLRSEIADLEAAQQQARIELEALAKRRQAAAHEIAGRENEILELLRRKEELEKDRVAAENRRAELAERIQALREETQKTRATLHEVEQEGQNLRLRHSEQELRIGDLAEKVRDEHRQDLAELHKDYQEPDVDWEALRAQMNELKRKLDNMGTVNLLAIQEQDELEQRADFLASQEQDLLKAKHSLQEVIRKVNRRSRQLFEQTFTAVRENFQALFRKLFGGGKADILLEPDVDVLEAGVEIIARPPGKELTKISLLSGGEKALAAVALLFAIFKSKPSPFCILDEVDAALDDSNIGRFIGVLREFLKEAQFIIITHSKQTMGEADVLYGITMAEAGVSTRVAVRLDDVRHSRVA